MEQRHSQSLLREEDGEGEPGGDHVDLTTGFARITRR
ncbi:DUF6191 domain-containing protein [Stackebrandtia albiflava]